MISLRYRVFCISIILCLLSTALHGKSFYAFSLGEAQRRMEHTKQKSAELSKLAGISRIAGMVYDNNTGDVIMVGRRDNRDNTVTLDDLVVAMRAVLTVDEYPYVSIDKTQETSKTGKLTVNFRGQIHGTKFGNDLLRADVILKEISLGTISAELWGVKSYPAISVNFIGTNPRELEDQIRSRFWFYPKRASLAMRQGVATIRESVLGVETRVDYAVVNGKPVDNLQGVRDKIGDVFTEQVTRRLDDLCAAYPEIARLQTLLTLTTLAEGMKLLKPKPELDYWLNEYQVVEVDTPKYHDVIEKNVDIECSGGRTLKLRFTGGIELNPIVLRLRAGDVTALREAVLQSRPSRNTLSWRVPLEGWCIPGYAETEGEYQQSTVRRRHNGGFSLDREISGMGRQDFWNRTFSNPQISMPKINIHDNLIPQQFSSNVGGVMLDGVAKVGSGGKVQVDLTSGNFSIIVDGKGARIAPEAFRKFVTALWSVYYSNQDPGISIDPIAPGVDKHIVRYIGKVINTDLGRVMRDADYLMKKWSVGTQRPDIRGFRNPDNISGRRGYAYLGASRFWFVPEDMRFKRAGNTLLFDDGRMTVKTEYLFDNNTGMNADPANEQFAQFLTDRYDQFAEKHPVLQELFDYAKMVSLAKYLKESGVPLYWFLMANKDLVLTEDSPGTVEALAKGSDYFKNLRIEGGVDLGVQGNYVYDSQAVKAIRKAVSKYGTAPKPTIRDREIPSVGRSFSFDIGGQSYSVVPQHSLTSGKDRRGIRYQTDFALRARGFKLTEQSWEALKHDVTYREFAKQWNHYVDTLSKSQLESDGQRLYKETWEKAGKKVANDLQNLKNLIGKKYDSEEAYTRAVQSALGPSSDEHLTALAKKYAYYQTDLEVVRFFNPKRKTQGQFGQGWHLLIPYRIKPFGTAKRDFLNVRIPEKMAVENLISGKQEVLTFNTERYTAAGYVPEKIKSSQVVGLFIMTDASYRLVDKLGNEFCFDKAGYLTDMSFSRDHHIKIEYLDSFEDVFEKSPCQIQLAGQERIQVLNVSVPKVMVVKDLLNNSSEEFVFTEEIGAYIPKKGVTSRFEVLNLMLDASFRLHDKQGNVIAFRSDGRFASFAVSPDSRMVKSISAGPYKVDFNYTVGSFSRVLIASAELSEDGESKPLYAVEYDYDREGRLCKARRSEVHVAKNAKCAQTEMLVASRRGVGVTPKNCTIVD